MSSSSRFGREVVFSKRGVELDLDQRLGFWKGIDGCGGSLTGLVVSYRGIHVVAKLQIKYETIG